MSESNESETRERKPPENGLVEGLRARRPLPRREFADDLRTHLLQAQARVRRPKRLRLLVAAYLACGAVLLVLAAVGASGGGPFR
jgi:hypothetical protein